MRRFRRILFLLFATAYLVSCPLMVLYALGYSFQPGRRDFVQTGLIDLTTTPPGASVYLGNRRYTRTTPTMLRDLLPGTYAVKLTLKGYRPWGQTVVVEPEKATAFERILLLPQQWTRQLLWPSRIQAMIPLPSDRWIILRAGPRLGDVFIYEWNERHAWVLAPSDAVLGRAVVRNVQPDAEGNACLIDIDGEDGPRTLWLDLQGRTPRVENITDWVRECPRPVVWDALDRRHLLLLQRDGIARIDVMEKTGALLRVGGVHRFRAFRKALYVAREDGALDRMDLDGKNSERVFDGSLLTRFTGALRGVARVAPSGSDVVLVVTEQGALLANHPPYQLVEDGVVGLEWSSSRKQVLVWQHEALGVVDVSRARGAEGGVAEELRVRWLYPNGHQVQQALWAFGDSHVLIRDEDRVLLLDLTVPVPHAEPIVRVSPRSGIGYSEDTGLLVYMEPLMGTLCALELVPRRERLAFPFVNDENMPRVSLIGQTALDAMPWLGKPDRPDRQPASSIKAKLLQRDIK